MDTPWKQLSYKDTEELNQAIAYIHHAALLVASVGDSLLPKADDDSQSNLEWLPGINALGGQMVDGSFRAALRYLPFELLVLDDQNRIREGKSIPGKSKEELMIWLQQAVTRTGGDGKNVNLIDHFDIPDHAVAQGEAFPEIHPGLHNELIYYRSNADWVLNEVAGLYKDVTPVRTWPHHFDTGAIMPLEQDQDGKATKTIGIGWAIPDQNFAEPYFYVNHWTEGDAPDYDQLPALEGAGKWYLEDWKGAALKSSDVIEHKQTADQQQEVLQFFRSAIRATKSFLQ
ncbi:hypothetical protein [Flavilitoribacter nigricans]|uniref:Uncharacterized protein n=1 Tax=Flavilitoribacter nigricans (strain ATCC 23147 / DSM 23189 / NBRC 102662 / NCIMB 1420 / SS-2) TaxID=1122177 RepID=A0A2D0N4I3_FLAN2|nr:hypothetical protein [Flavilitoribacter nigricans]PHN03298.1 hypothetical protein CRP01_28310 [Flavilitoribacter nigricans DSM 23189 = NBRC 102662]